MIVYVLNNDGLYCFVESVTKDRKSSLKLTKSVGVTGQNGATSSKNSMNLTRENAYRNCENAQWCKYINNY